jgi:hypothetical protein
VNNSFPILSMISVASGFRESSLRTKEEDAFRSSGRRKASSIAFLKVSCPVIINQHKEGCLRMKGKQQ